MICMKVILIKKPPLLVYQYLTIFLVWYPFFWQYHFKSYNMTIILNLSEDRNAYRYCSNWNLGTHINLYDLMFVKVNNKGFDLKGFTRTVFWKYLLLCRGSCVKNNVERCHERMVYLLTYFWCSIYSWISLCIDWMVTVGTSTTFQHTI